MASIEIKKHNFSTFKKTTAGKLLKSADKIYTVFLNEAIKFPVILEAKVKKKIWLKITIDSNEKEKYLLQPGEYISWQIRNNFELIAGDAGGIDLWLNNVPVRFAKKMGYMLYFRLNSEKQRRINKI